MKIELDKEALFALASDTRLDLLKALASERRTVTQLAEHLDMDKAGVYRHLKKLENGGFVKKFEDHSFVYYGLTWRARGLISPGENTTVVVLISITAVLSALGLLMTAVLLGAFDGVGNISSDNGTWLLSIIQDPVLIGAVTVILLAAAITSAFYALRILFKPRQS